MRGADLVDHDTRRTVTADGSVHFAHRVRVPKHLDVLPRIGGPVIVQLSLFACIALVVQTGINFLGLGVPP